MSGRSTNTQMAINVASGVGVFAMGLCVSFFLTPFIVSKLGIAAYGFIGLSNNIIDYASLLTIAVNSMAGRYITIKYHENDTIGANSYLSSIFYANLLLSAVIMTSFSIIAYFLPDLVRIPETLVGDVQTLFVLLGLSSCIGPMTGVIGVSCFIKNRLDLSNIRGLIGTTIRVVLLLLLFGLCTPKLCYFGVSGLVLTIYVIISNWVLFRKLTPELRISSKFFAYKRLLEVVASGSWNIINKLSGLLSRGFDLLLANIFIGATAMGQLSITQAIPFLILSFFASFSGNFAPEFTRLYAQNNMDGLKHELLKSVRISALFSCIPVVCVYIFSDVFYELWIPEQDSTFLYYLTLAAMISIVIALPLEPLWYIFTITNQVKRSSLNLFYNSLLSFGFILSVMFFINDTVIKLFVLASSRSIFGLWRIGTFLPIFGAKCLGFPRTTFYPLMGKVVLNVLLICPVAYVLKHYVFCTISWFNLMIEVLLTALIGLLITMFTILRHSDRQFIFSKIKKVLS